MPLEGFNSAGFWMACFDNTLITIRLLERCHNHSGSKKNLTVNALDYSMHSVL